MMRPVMQPCEAECDHAAGYATGIPRALVGRSMDKEDGVTDIYQTP